MLDVEERTQNFKRPYHCPTIWVKLGMGHIQVLQQSTLKHGQWQNNTQDLKQAPVHKKEGWTTRRHP